MPNRLSRFFDIPLLSRESISEKYDLNRPSLRPYVDGCFGMHVAKVPSEKNIPFVPESASSPLFECGVTKILCPPADSNKIIITVRKEGLTRDLARRE